MPRARDSVRGHWERLVTVWKERRTDIRRDGWHWERLVTLGKTSDGGKDHSGRETHEPPWKLTLHFTFFYFFVPTRSGPDPDRSHIERCRSRYVLHKYKSQPMLSEAVEPEGGEHYQGRRTNQKVRAPAPLTALRLKRPRDKRLVSEGGQWAADGGLTAC